MPIEAWPRPRTTNDLDLFVPIELLVQLPDMQIVRTVLDELNFKAINGALFWQFVVPDTDVKVDLLTGPIPEEAKSLLDIEGGKKGRRVRPKGDLELHARRTPEALGLTEYQEDINVEGKLSNGDEYSGIIHIPSPFTYLMMKVTAFGDQVTEERREFGRHHALDVYRVVAMVTEQQFEQTREQFSKYVQEPVVQNVVAVAQQFFDSPDSPGNIRMREHAFYGDNMNMAPS